MKSILLAPDLPVQLNVLVETRMLINAASGGGKSRTLRRLLEQTHGKIQQIVIDPEGEFPSLREKFDYVLAARHGGDTIADPRSAALLAERLLELRVSAIIDLYDLKKDERKRFVRLFCDALMGAPKRLWHPVLVGLDEAHQFAPEDEEAESLGSVVDLASQGRKRGFCLIAATQRLSKLSKDVAAELRNVMIGTTVLDVDMKRAADVLGFDKAQRLTLRELEAGQFWTFGPALVKAPTLITVGDVVTSHPKIGERGALPPPPPTAKIRALLPQLADLPAEAEEKARTEAELRKELAVARATLTRMERAKPATATVESTRDVRALAVRVASYRQALEAAVKFIVEINAQDFAKGLGEGVDATKLQAAIDAAVQKALGIIEESLTVRRREFLAYRRQGERVLAQLQRVLGEREVKVSVTVRENEPFTVKPASVRASGGTREPAAVADGLTRPQQRILDGLAWLESVGIGQAQRAQLGFLADASPKSSAFANNLGTLRSGGFIAYQNGAVGLTEAGRGRANAPEAPLTADELQRMVLERVTGPQARILRALIEAYPDAIARDALASTAEASATSSAYANNLGFLRSLGLIDYRSGQAVVALPVLFPGEES